VTPYEELLEVASNEGVTVVDYELGEKMLGLYCDGYILIGKQAGANERYCTLAEELGHHFTAASNIVELDNIDKCKQERLGRRWGFEKILPLNKIVSAIIDGYDNLPTLAEQLEVTPEYLQETLVYYGQKYGPRMEYNGYIVLFSDVSITVYPAMDEII